MTLAEDRKSMIAALKKLVAPYLRTLGFSGSFPHYRRLLDNHTDLITFQFDRHGGGFVVEVAKGPPGEFVMPWGERVSPKNLTAHHLNPDQRRRLGTRSKGDNYWFRYDRPKGRDSRDIFDRLANEVLEQMSEQADSWWQAT